ncbi:Protein of unknown function DUF89 [Actinacidiphila alni]|uniref:Damage-control phosphatase ARMT1-like metal-binding domain-containing protein n=2 Tax=Actinacidiphila alni TaxID=380248 RepID=A0A1I2JI79_9ACTN|nr:Protein of unknown function DUF89 [Actinacidiphila alni]
MVMSGTPGSFARSVLTDRHPVLLRQVADGHPYPPDVRRALDALAEETAAPAAADATDGPSMGPLPTGAAFPDRELWERWGVAHYVGRKSWYDVPFLWAENWFYRRLLAAVGWFGPGPWQGVDPFAPVKRAELAGAEVAAELAALDGLDALAPGERDQALLRAALWGNRADLGFRLTADAGTTPDSAASAVLADDSPALWRHLAAAPPGTAAVHLIADNAGRELIPDLILLDHLLNTGRAATAVLHVKPYPYFVSDATTADVLECVRRIGRAPGRAGETGVRLREALGDGRLAIRTHPFFCAPLPYAAMPGDLRAELGGATVTLLKGDLNYRRLVGDRWWPPTSGFAAATAYFPGPLAALRTLKSDVVVGLDAATVAGLDADSRTTGTSWRTSGTYAVVQTRT